METTNTLAERIHALGDAGKYKEQGEEFLKATGSTLEVSEANPKRAPEWADDKGTVKTVHYSCTLSNAHGSYTFDYWGSIRDAEMLRYAEEVSRQYLRGTPLFFHVSDFLEKETGTKAPTLGKQGEIVEKVREAIKPNAYEILAALHDSAGDSFEDFCANYGYDEDSQSAERVYHAILEQERNMLKLYDRNELEALAEIV